MKSTRLFLYSSGAILATIVTLTSCAGVAGSRTQTPPKQEVKQPVPVAQVKQTRPVNSKFVEAKTRFGFKLFSEILKEDRQKNVFVSPSSVALALAMTYNGAGGETKQAMANALELQGMTLEEVNQANANLKQVLQDADPKVQLSIANSLWASQEISFNPDFIRRNESFYDAKVETVDFRNPAAPEQINNWVKESTRGKISQIVDKINPDQAMFLLNAIYFKGNWTEKFNKSQTQERPFYLADGTQKNHPLMKQNGKYSYYETDKFQAVSLPYGNERLSFYVFLPKSKAGLPEFEKSLNAQNWQTWMTQFRKRQGSIQIPRFKMSYDVDLNGVLSALGMQVAFDANNANFSGLSSAKTKIDQVKHKTFVEVNEEGTEAAAVTSVGIMPTSIQIGQEPFNLVVDRPFFCAIRDNQTGEILFMGSIVNPEQS
jgi:serine protease inhibitor